MNKKSDLLNDIINNINKSCLKCINFKIKPFIKDKNDVSINFKITKNSARCIINKLNTNSLNIVSINNCNSKDSILLSSVLKSPNRYRRIALYCSDYNSDP